MQSPSCFFHWPAPVCARPTGQEMDGSKRETMSTATISETSSTTAITAPVTSPTTSPLELAVRSILAKESKQTILSKLGDQCGLYGEDALAVVKQAYALKHAAFRKAGVKMVLIGIAMLVIGVLITAGTYSMVSEKGGAYFVTYGLILVGVVKIVQGLFRIIVG
jgi:hypothetical protein